MTVPAAQAATTVGHPNFQTGGSGEVYSFTIVTDAPPGFDEQAPYVLALIKLDEGPMLTAQMTDVYPDEVEMGMRVEMVTRKLRTEGTEGIIAYGYKFRPVHS